MPTTTAPTRSDAKTPRTKMTSPSGRLSLASLTKASLTLSANCEATMAAMPRMVWRTALMDGARGASRASRSGRRRHGGGSGRERGGGALDLALAVDGVDAGGHQDGAAEERQKIGPDGE